MREVSVLLSLLTVAAVAGAQTAPADRGSAEASASARFALMAVQKYGWAIPLCLQRTSGDRHQTCVSASRLASVFPFHRRFVYQIVLGAAEKVSGVKPQGSRPIEAFIQELVDAGLVVGCIAKGPNAGVVTIGPSAPQIGVGSIPRGGRAGDPCAALAGGSDPTDAFGVGIGSLVGAFGHSRQASLGADGSATMLGFLADCEQRARTPGLGRGSAMSGESEDEKVKKAEEEAKKKAEAAKKAQEEAQRKRAEAEAAKKAAEEAKRKAEEASKKAADTYADPNATADDKLKAGQAAVAAQNDYWLAQANANKATADADVADESASDAARVADDAQRAVDQARRDADYGHLVDEATNDLLSATTSNVWGQMYQWGRWTSRVLGAWWGTYGYGANGESCLVGECAYTSCHTEALVRALQEEMIRQRGGATCNLTVYPNPESADRCYDRGFGLLGFHEVTLAEAVRASCSLRARVSDMNCNKIRVPEFIRQGALGHPCDLPEAICTPEQAASRKGPLPGVGPSPLPAPQRSIDPMMWGSPKRITTERQ